MVVSQLMAVSKIEENTWNPNKMSFDAWVALVNDMKQGGPNAIDPILIASKRVIYQDLTIPEDAFVAIDGNHRLRAAKKLGWSKIPALPDPSIIDEEMARAISYAKNFERGSMDPYRQAEYFKWFVKRGWTHEQIAEKHRIDRTTVTKHLSLIKIEPNIRKTLAKVPRVTISHLEPIATLKPKQQKELVKNVMLRGGKREAPSVRSIEFDAHRIKEADRLAEKLKKAVEKAKYPKCPTCGKPASSISYSGLPNVRCPNYHEWSLEKGAYPSPWEKAAEKKKAGKPQPPKYIRSTHPIDDFRKAFAEYVRGLIPKIEEINNISCWGNNGRREVHVSADIRGIMVSMSVHIDGKDYTLHIEPKTYSSEKLKAFKTKVTMWPEPKRKADLAKMEQLVSEIFKKVKGK